MEQPTIAVCPLCGAALSDETVCPRCGQAGDMGEGPARPLPFKKEEEMASLSRDSVVGGVAGLRYRHSGIPHLSQPPGFPPKRWWDNWNTALRQEDPDLFFSLFGEHFDPTEDYWLSLLEQPVYLELLDYQIGDHGKMAKLRVRISAGREEVYSTVSYMFAVRDEGKWVFSLLYV